MIPSSNKSDSKSKRKLVADSLTMGVVFAVLLTGIQRIVGFVRSILFCRVLPEEELGTWSLTWSFLMLLAPLAVLGLPGTFGRYVEYFRQRGQLRVFLARIALVSVILTIALVALLAALAPSFAELLFRDASKIQLVYAIAFALFFVGVLNFSSSLVEALRQVRLVTIMRFISGIAFAVAALTLLIFWNTDASAVTIGFGISCLIGTIPAVWFLLRHWDNLDECSAETGQRSMWSKIAPFAVWLWLTNLATNLYEISDRYMLLQYLPVSPNEAQAAIGQYHSARVVPLLMVSLATVLGGILLPYMANAWENKRYKDAKAQLSWSIKLLGVGFSLCGVIILFASPLLFDVILQGRYNAGLAILPMTLTYCIWYSLVLIGQDYLWCNNRGRLLFAAYIGGLLFNIVLNLVLIPSFGLDGAVWATAVSNIVCLALLLFFNQRLGFHNDRGIYIAVLAPLALLLPMSLALIILINLAWFGYRRGWIFTADETKQLNEFLAKLSNRLPAILKSRTKQSAT